MYSIVREARRGEHILHRDILLRGLTIEQANSILDQASNTFIQLYKEGKICGVEKQSYGVKAIAKIADYSRLQDTIVVDYLRLEESDTDKAKIDAIESCLLINLEL